jgi:hypothetical protein
MTKQELEAENDELRDTLAQAREQLRRLDALLTETLDEEDDPDPGEEE